MIVRKWLGGLNNLVQIRIHELIHQVDILEALPLNWHHHILQSNHIFMPKMLQQLQFPQRPQRINSVLKRIVDLLNRNFLVRFPVHGRANDAVRSSTDRFDRHVFGIDLEQGLPHGIVMLSLRSNPIWRLNLSRHFLHIKFYSYIFFLCKMSSKSSKIHKRNATITAKYHAFKSHNHKAYLFNFCVCQTNPNSHLIHRKNANFLQFSINKASEPPKIVPRRIHRRKP